MNKNQNLTSKDKDGHIFYQNIFNNLKYSEKHIVVHSIKGIESYFALKKYFVYLEVKIKKYMNFVVD